VAKCHPVLPGKSQTQIYISILALSDESMLTYTAFSEKSIALSRCLTIIAVIAAPVSTAVTSVVSIAILATWLISGQALKTLKISFQHPVGKMILLFFAWLAVGTFYSYAGCPSKITSVLIWKKLIFVYILLGLFSQPQWQRRFVYSYVISMVMAGAAAFLLWTMDLGRSGLEPGIFMTNHSTQSMAFVAAFLCCMFLANGELRSKYKHYIWAAGILFLFNIFFISPARSGYLALPPAAFFAGVYIYGYKKLPHIAAILVGIVLVAALSSETLQQRIKLGLEEQANYQSSRNETSIGIRMVFYHNVLEIIKEKPIFGYGTSCFRAAYSAHVSSKEHDWRKGITPDPHNQYMFVWVENGLIGLLIFFGYIYIAIREGLRNKLYGGIAASFLVAICASSLFNSHFKTFAEGYLLAFFLGALLAHSPGNQPAPDTNA
jgi:O-antigen ligase